MNELQTTIKQAVPVNGNVLATFQHGDSSKVQFWYLSGEGVKGVGLYDGRIAILDAVDGFDGFQDDRPDDAG